MMLLCFVWGRMAKTGTGLPSQTPLRTVLTAYLLSPLLSTGQVVHLFLLSRLCTDTLRVPVASRCCGPAGTRPADARSSSGFCSRGRVASGQSVEGSSVQRVGCICPGPLSSCTCCVQPRGGSQCRWHQCLLCPRGLAGSEPETEARDSELRMPMLPSLLAARG